MLVNKQKVLTKIQLYDIYLMNKFDTDLNKYKGERWSCIMFNFGYSKYNADLKPHYDMINCPFLEKTNNEHCYLPVIPDKFCPFGTIGPRKYTFNRNLKLRNSFLYRFFLS